MQYINHWPDITKLALPEIVSKEFYQRLLEPFDSKSAAKKFWNESPSTIIILDHIDSISSLKQHSAWKQIAFALSYPEYTIPLKLNYKLLLAITNDSGSGIYLVIPPALSHIISDYQSSL